MELKKTNGGRKGTGGKIGQMERRRGPVKGKGEKWGPGFVKREEEGVGRTGAGGSEEGEGGW